MQESGVWNAGIWSLESGIWSLESGISEYQKVKISEYWVSSSLSLLVFSILSRSLWNSSFLSFTIILNLVG